MRRLSTVACRRIVGSVFPLAAAPRAPAVCSYPKCYLNAAVSLSKSSRMSSTNATSDDEKKPVKVPALHATFEGVPPGRPVDADVAATEAATSAARDHAMFQQWYLQTVRSSASDWRRAVFSSWQRGLATAVGLLSGVGAMVFVLYGPMRDDTVHQTAHIASQALEDQRVKENAIQLTRSVVEQILTDPKSVELLADVVSNLLQKEQSRVAVTRFIKDIFEDHYTQEVTKKFVLKIVTDPWIMDQLHHIFLGLLEDLLQDPKTRAGLKELLVESAGDALKDHELRAQSGKAVRAIVWQTIWNSGQQPTV